jgi:polyribonucleotide nucleotidyltransferase
MGLKIPISTSFNLPDGREVTLETGKLATQADGSVMVRMGNTMLLATVVSAHEARPGQDFFPMSVDYQEKFAAAGRIPGNFFRRETKLSDYEVLISRLCDRPIRPLFPKGYMFDTQIILTLISGDKDTMPDALACLAASAAICVSDIPFAGPVSEVRVARIGGEFKVNPTRTELAAADMDFIVAATMDNILMVEGEAKECAEADLLEAMKIGHEAIKVQCAAQTALAALVGDKALIKREIAPAAADEDLKAVITEFCTPKIQDIARSASDKNARKAAWKSIKKELEAELTEKSGEEYVKEKSALTSAYYDKVKKHAIRMVALEEGIRLDGRKLDEVRPIWTEIGYLPAAHGSSIFNRGETQALTSLTLGTKLDEAMVDTALLMGFDKFILHYNFPGFSVGEVKPQRAPARREVGHANLAGRSLRQVMPSPYPYTVRLVSDILESNGSSSMATVCAGSMALMDGGVPIKAPVAGIAMGMIAEGGKVAILSDILGDEDALGDMDFKITGTETGICGCQMDMKIDGLSYEVLHQALNQAKEGRLHILGKMAESISTHAEDLKPHAPRVVEIIVDKDFIGAVIGPGGKVIQEMQRETGTTINIEEKEGKGHINVFGTSKTAIDAVIARISKITYMPNVGDIVDGVIETLQPYGVFVGFGGKSGLLHVSEMSYDRIDNVEEHFNEGDPIQVQIVDIDKKTGKLRLSAKSLMTPPPGREREASGPREDRGGDRGGFRDNRGGGGGGFRDNRGGGRDDRGGGRDNRGGGGGGFRR